MKKYIRSSTNELWVCNHCGHRFTLNNADIDYCLRPGRSFGDTDTVPYYRCPKCGFSTISRVQD